MINKDIIDSYSRQYMEETGRCLLDDLCMYEQTIRPKSIEFDDVLERTCKYFGIKESEIKNNKRGKLDGHKKWFYYLCRKVGYKNSEIARYLNKDQTTISTGIHKFLKNVNSEYVKKVEPIILYGEL